MSGLAALAVAAGLWWAFRERPAGVDVAVVAAGTMTVAVEEDGIARVREVYRLSAPVAGRLDRTLLDEGDAVVANVTVVARLKPLDPPFLDDRTRAEITAAIDAAAAAVALAEAQQQSADAALTQARADLQRAERLATTGVVSESQLEKARAEVRVSEAQLASAAAQVKLRQSELASARARLIGPGDNAAGGGDSTCCVAVTAPIDGVVLDMLVRSEQVIAAGSPLADIGDPHDIEIAIDLLSQDAVRLAPGAPVTVTGYGGPPLTGRLRLVSPSAATKVSALGIEEQRVAALVDLDSPAPGLGHNFRVRAAIEEWRSDDAVTVPVAALFREGADWAAYRIEDGRARRVRLDIGRLNGRQAEVKAGLAAGDRVILHPSDVIADGTLVAARDGL